MKTFAIGDIHGGYRAFIEVLEKSNFDYENDRLIALGDVCDGWPETPEAIEELLKIKNLIYVKGNHDDWAVQGLTNAPGFMTMDGQGSGWLAHGGQATIDAYERKPELLEKHIQFLEDALLYHIDEENRLFLHAGFNPKQPFTEQTNPYYPAGSVYYWDREFWQGMYTGANSGKDFNEVYIGHTPTLNYPNGRGEHLKPMNRRNVWNMDTGACFTGALSMMDIDTKEIFQSQPVWMLYPSEQGRNGQSFTQSQRHK